MADEVVTQLANKLADDCLKVQDVVGEDRLFMKLGDVLGASSQTLEEAFLTAVRTRMANAQGEKFLKDTLDAHQAKVQAGE